MNLNANHFDKPNGLIKSKLKTNSGIEESVDGFEVNLKTNGGISKDADGLFLTYK